MKTLACTLDTRPIYVALSGGADSVAILHYVKNTLCLDVTAVHVNHGSESAYQHELFVAQQCSNFNVPLITMHITATKPAKLSQEEFWRNERLNFFHGLDGTVVTGHHLNDAVETYLFNAFNGKPYTMPVRNKNICRPLLLTSKQDVLAYCTAHNLEYVMDESNNDVKYARNRIRHNVLPEVLKINPGILTVVRKLIEKAIYDSRN